MHTKSNIIIALDFPEKTSCLIFVDQLDPQLCRLKIGKELFTHYGPPLIEELMRRGFDIFLDLKFHDIPNTVAGACRVAAELGVWMLNVHALGGEKMLHAAYESINKFQHRPILVGVTILTSHYEADLKTIGLQGNIQENVLRLATLSKNSGLDGVVCSAQETKMLRENLGSDFCLVTPGIRLPDSPSDDQQRVMTPKEALALGANYLVIGRPITQANDPMVALQACIV